MAFDVLGIGGLFGMGPHVGYDKIHEQYAKQREINTGSIMQASNAQMQMLQRSYKKGTASTAVPLLDVTKGAITDKSKSVDTPIPAMSSNGPVTVHGNGELVVDAKRTSIMENMIENKDFYSLGKFAANTIDFYKERDAMKGSDSAKKGTYDLGPVKKKSILSTTEEKTIELSGKDFNPMNPTSVAFERNKLFGNKGMNSKKPEVKPKELKPDDSPLSKVDAIEPVLKKSDTKSIPTTDMTSSLLKLIDENYKQSRKGNLIQQGINAGQILNNVSQEFVSPPKQMNVPLVQHNTDFETMNQVVNDEITKQTESSLRNITEHGADASKLAAIHANLLDAKKSGKIGIFKMMQEERNSNVDRIGNTIEHNNQIDYTNASNEFNSAGQFNANKNAAISSNINNIMVGMSAMSANRSAKLNDKMTAVGLPSQAKLIQDYNDFVAVKKKSGDIGKDVTFDITHLQEK